MRVIPIVLYLAIFVCGLLIRIIKSIENIFKCVVCGSLAIEKQNEKLICTTCKREYAIHDNIYDFRVEPNKKS